MLASRPPLDVVLPVHNEALTIEALVVELRAALAPTVVANLIICEDGSRDGTGEVLARMAASQPLHLITGPHRKGYSRAMVEGLAHTTSEWVLCLDADGQCAPGDFPLLWERRHGVDLVTGWRRERADTRPRRFVSGAFHAVYRSLFDVPVHDPSCPYALLRRAAIAPLLGELGLLEFGFWWELVARAHRSGLHITEVPIHHRPRVAGQTSLFTANRLPGLAVSHLIGLGRLWAQTR